MASLSGPAFPWYAIRVRSRHEKTVLAALTGKGFSPFVPFYASSRRSSGPTPSQLPFFPGYVFSRFDCTQLLPILTTSGVVSIVHDYRGPIPVEESEIDALVRLVASGVTPRTCAYISEGERVRVEEGPLRGTEGIFVRGKSVSSIVISVSILQRSLNVEVPRELVTPLRTYRTPAAHTA